MPHCSPVGVYFLCAKAGCNRLRRSPQSLSIRWSDFKILHACEHAIQQRSTVLHIPTTPSSNSDMIQLFFILFLTLGRSHRSIDALVLPQHSLGQSVSKVPNFQFVWLPLLSLFVPVTINCFQPSAGSETKLSRAPYWCSLAACPLAVLV